MKKKYTISARVAGTTKYITVYADTITDALNLFRETLQADGIRDEVLHVTVRLTADAYVKI